jgi:predicted DNA-binding WGR domain protein
MNRREFHSSEGPSNKFWAITVTDNRHIIAFGRLGTAGQTQVKQFPTAAAAQAAAEKLIAEKLRKGYAESAQPKPPAAAPSPVAERPRRARAKAASACVVAAPPAEAPPLDLARPVWLSPLAPPRQTRPLPQPRPFDYDACVDRWDNHPKEGAGTDWQWWKKLNAEVFVSPPAVSAEEARFWLLANAELGLSKEYLGPEHKRRRARTPTEKQCRTPLSASAVVKAMETCPYPPPLYSVLFSLLSPEEVVPLVQSGKYYAVHEGWNREIPHSLDHLPGAVLFYVVPYLSDAEIEELRGHVRRALERAKADSEVWLLAAYLELAPELQEYVQARKPEDRGIRAKGGHHLVFNLADAGQVASQARRLKIFLGDYDDMVSAWLIRTGVTALDHLRDSILQQKTKAAAAKMTADLCQLTAPEMAPTLLELKLSSRAPAPATAWLEQHPAEAVAGLLPLVSGSGKLADAALNYLREARRKGFAERIAGLLEQHPAVAERVRREVLEHADQELSPFDEATTPRWLGALSAPVAAAPPSDWLRLGSLPDVQVGEHRMNQAQVEALLAELQASDLGRPRPLVSAVRQHVSGPVRDAFAWALFECWLEGGAPLSDAWGFLALGLLGGDGVALKLAPLLRGWPLENQHKRAATGLECLRAIGTDLALRQLRNIAQTIKFKGLRARARECLEERLSADVET